jgi:hypothetical protein
LNTHVRVEHASQTPTPSANERVAADAKLQQAFLRAMSRGSSRELSQGVASESPERSVVAPGSTTMTLMTLRGASDETASPRTGDPELIDLLERFSSQMFVAEGSRTTPPRVLLTLQGELAGASTSAEVVREGVFLRVRLRAGNAATYERMQSRREFLLDALTAHVTRSNVIVEVVREQGHGGGGAR